MLPNLVIIGAMKSGTSSLHRYLDLHPQIQMSSLKELDFFILEKNWNKSLTWYQNQFLNTNTNDIKIYGESSPNYTKSHLFSGVPERMSGIIPNAKLIYILRDPIKRILSHYYHQAVDSQETQSLLDVLKKTDNNYVYTSRYYFQLQQFLEYYQQEQILILTLEELNREPLDTVQKVFEFLCVEASFQHPDFVKSHHQASDKTKINTMGRLVAKLPAGLRLCSLFPRLFTETIEYPELNEELICCLQEQLRGDIEQLRIFTGQTFSDWMI